MKNLTGLKSFDRPAADPRILEIRSEGADGYWADLADGYEGTGSYEGCISLRGDTVRALLDEIRGIRPRVRAP